MSEESKQSSGRTRGVILNLFKIALGIGIIWFIASKLELDDRVVRSDGKLITGRHLEVDGSLVFTTPKGERRVPLSEGPILEQNDAGGILYRVRLPRIEEPIDARDPRFVGELRLRSNGEELRIPFGEVALKKGVAADGWIERVPDVAEGLVTIFSRLSLLRYGLALLLMAVTYAAGVLRWHLLLRAQDLKVSLWQATRLTFIGFFFNNVVPGLTGGDVIKAVMIARRNKGRGAEAVTTVIVDRVIGIVVLATVSGIILALTYPRYQDATIAIFLFLFAAVSGVIVFFSRRVRRILRIDQLLKRLPAAQTLQRLDQAVLIYRRKPKVLVWSVFFSALSHGANVGSVCLMGLDLGVDNAAGMVGTPIVTYFATVPVILIISSVPVLPGGWGVGELMYGYFFRAVGVRNLSLSVGLSVLTRASMLLYSLLGGVFLLFERRETREALQEAKDENPASMENSGD